MSSYKQTKRESLSNFESFMEQFQNYFNKFKIGCAIKNLSSFGTAQRAHFNDNLSINEKSLCSVVLNINFNV